MAKLIKNGCTQCGRPVYRSHGRMNENRKFGWKVYCSRKCEYEHKSKGQLLSCENCGKRLRRPPHAISPHNYCSSSCAAIVNNRKCLKGHAKIKPKLKTYIECGERFRKSMGNKKYCSMKCKNKAERYMPEELLSIIKNTFKKLGRVPAKRELSRGADKACVKLFGSWNNAIIAAGFKPNRSHSQRMYKRIITKAADGHPCDSISEAVIDNWLVKNNISHKRDICYPTTNHKADWEILIGDKKIFVEYFGLANDSPRYDRAIKEKGRLCERHEIPLISIYPKDIYPLKTTDKNLKEKFKKFLNN